MTEKSREPVQLGSCAVTFLPHYLPGVGGRVFVIMDDQRPHDPRNFTPDDARMFAARLKLAADEAEAMARRAQRPKPAA